MINLAMALFNRATYSRSKALIHKLVASPDIKLRLYVGSALLDPEYGMAVKYIREECHGLMIEEIKYRAHAGKRNRISLVSSDILAHLSEYLKEARLNGFIVVADRFETLPASMAASYNNIPVIHIQGGEVTGNIDERIRHAVTKLSDYHFPCTVKSSKNLVKMGEDSERVFMSGCPSLDLIRSNNIKRDDVGEYFMCIFHPDTELDTQYDQTDQVLRACLEFSSVMKVRCKWFYPNPDFGREEIIRLIADYHYKFPEFFEKAVNKSSVKFLKEFANARFIVGNSSVGFREGSYLGVPCINVGDRQADRERTENVFSCTPKAVRIVGCMHQQNGKTYPSSDLYGNGKAANIIRYHLMQSIDYTLKPALYYGE